MARPRTASNILELKGAFKRNPSRKREREHEPEAEGDIGPAPEWFSNGARQCWDEIVGLCHRGTLCKADRLIVEHAAHLLELLRTANWIAHPSLLIRFEAALGKLGLTPADRSKVKAKLAPPKNAFADL